MTTNQLIVHSLDEAQETLRSFIEADGTVECIECAAAICAEALAKGCKIITCGNGGSLCDATHFAEELTGRYRQTRRPLPAICINDPAYLTCTANDFSYADTFARYVEGVGCKGDVLLAFSTSGKSENVLRAADAAREKGIKVIAFTSAGENPLTQKANIAICAPRAPHSDRIQEIHIKVVHILIECIEHLLAERSTR
ncbi:MAG: SIS domain-containing protein [Bacteroidaceae bacterium]|nr:SIS domain-containing protein [Bacteroidaceae bacterium]